MRILFLGNFQVDFSTESHYAKEYENLGHQVLRFQENESSTDDVLLAAEGADIFHYVHTHGWETPGTTTVAELIQQFKNRGVITIGVHLDYWYGLVRQQDVGTHPWWSCDYIFTADGGSNDWYRNQGINHHYLRAGVLSDECYLGTYREDFNCDIAFVGAYGYHPEWPYRPRLINWLAETYGDRFRRFAGDVPPHHTIRGSALNDLYASAKVTIGDTLCVGFDHTNYFSDRLFEATGRGGFVIFPHIKGIEESFHLGEELLTYEYENFAQLRKLIDHCLENPNERKKIQLAGHERTKAEHTYKHRVEEIFDVLQTDGAL